MSCIRVARVFLLLALLAQGTAGAQSGDAESFSLREIVRPGRVEALRLSIEGTGALSEDRTAEGVRALEEALRRDPYLAPAWTNLSAGYIQLCHAEGAFVAAMIGRVLDPSSRVAADNLRIAMGLDCEEPPVESFVTREEVAALRAQGDAALFVAAAGARRARGEHLLALFHEEWALRVGAEREASLSRVALDLESAGLLRAALAAQHARGDAAGAREKTAALGARRAEIVARARAVADEVAAEARLQSDDERRAAQEYAEILLARAFDEEAALELLRELLGVGRPSTLREPWGSITIGPEWATLRDEGTGAALAILRRFPGDTQVALFAWDGRFDPERASTSLLRALAARSALQVEPWSSCSPSVEGGHCSRTLLEIDTGLHGSARLEVRLYGAREGAPSLAVLVLPGEGGCGEECAGAAMKAVEDVLATLVPAPIREDAPPRLDETWRLLLPSAWRARRTYEEALDPWRTHPVGAGLRLDLPPGLVVGRVDGAFSDASCVRETRLWLRGSFKDADGIDVRLGDARWSGWVDLIPGGAGTLSARREQARDLGPRTDPAATFVRLASLDAALSRGRRPMRGHVALYEGGAMPGRWLVYDVAIGRDLVVIALPVLEGARSLALHWAALTLRLEEGERLPPPVDLSEALDVDFQRFEGRDAKRDPREGLLRAAELQVAVPRGYRVSLSASSRDGFPVNFRSDSGGRIVFERLPASRSATIASRRAQVEALYGAVVEPGWQSARLGRRAELAWARLGRASEGEGPRRVFIVAPSDPELPAFRVLMTRGEGVSAEAWDFEAEIVRDSLRLRRSKK